MAMTNESDGYVPLLEAVNFLGLMIFETYLALGDVSEDPPSPYAIEGVLELFQQACACGELTGAYRVGDSENNLLFDEVYLAVSRATARAFGWDIDRDELPLELAVEYTSTPRNQISLEFFIRRDDLTDYMALLGTLPRSLRTVLQRWPAPEPGYDAPLHKRGPQSRKLEGVIARMRDDIENGKLTQPELATMLEKVMANRYGVSRDTARKARLILIPPVAGPPGY
jgi:hypothetical protein